MVRTYRAKYKMLPAEFSTNFIAKMDGRAELTRRLSYAFNSALEDAGGVENIPYAKRALCERFAFLEEFLRQIENELVKGAVGRADLLGKWTQGVNAMTGLSKVLGVADPNKPKDWIDTTLYTDPSPERPTKSPTLHSVASGGGRREKVPLVRERLT